MKGRTPWFPRHIHPVRNGDYECVVRFAGGPLVRWTLPWDGKGFIVPAPMVVRQWRGMTRAAHQRAQQSDRSQGGAK